MSSAHPDAPLRRLTLTEVFAAFEAMHGGEHWHWTPETPPFEIMAGAVLVQRAAWTNAERALDRLRAAGALSPEGVLALPVAALEELVRPAGFFRTKARKLRALASAVQEHGGLDAFLGSPPEELRARLLAVWGIGPETADAILLYAAKQPAFVADAYAARVFRRLGLGPDRDSYDAWQAWFVRQLPVDPALWARLHALIVLHGKRRCRKRQPRCADCLLLGRCPGAITAPERGLP
ncbi:Ultraviolet N-glycosylase/AP lyase [bacterium HR29]|jgi:endonuclease-3 related protein|nr:Ultraviolet N-glycosylase/AP lyase [bacterium HR29]